MRFPSAALSLALVARPITLGIQFIVKTPGTYKTYLDAVAW